MELRDGSGPAADDAHLVGPRLLYHVEKLRAAVRVFEAARLDGVGQVGSDRLVEAPGEGLGGRGGLRGTRRSPLLLRARGQQPREESVALVPGVADRVLVRPRVALELELVEQRSGSVELRIVGIEVGLVTGRVKVGRKALSGGVGVGGRGVVGVGDGSGGAGDAEVHVGLVGSNWVDTEERSCILSGGVLVRGECARVVEDSLAGVAILRDGSCDGGLTGHLDVGGALVSDGVGIGGSVRILGVVSRLIASSTGLGIGLGSLGLLGFGHVDGDRLGLLGRSDVGLVFNSGLSRNLLGGDGLVETVSVGLLAVLASSLTLDCLALAFASSTRSFDGSARVWSAGASGVRVYLGICV